MLSLLGVKGLMYHVEQILPFVAGTVMLSGCLFFHIIFLYKKNVEKLVIGLSQQFFQNILC